MSRKHSEAIKARIWQTLDDYREKWDGPEADRPSHADLLDGATDYLIAVMVVIAKDHPRGMREVDTFLNMLRQTVVHEVQATTWGKVITPPPADSDGSYN